METEYDQSEMERAIIGHMHKDKMNGGLPSRLRATWSNGGRSLSTVSKAERYAAEPIPIIGPVNKPLK